MSKWIQSPMGYCPIIAFQDRFDWFDYNALRYYHLSVDAYLDCDEKYYEYLYLEYSARAQFAKWHMQRHPFYVPTP